MVVSNLRVVLKAFADGQIFGQVFGEGIPQILWLHGWGRSSNDFVAVGERLARQGICSVALDLPGFGASPLPPFVGGARQYAHFLEPMLDQIVGESPVVVVGHSFGGRVAAVMGARQPQKYRHIVFTGAPLVAKAGGRRRSPLPYRMVKKLAQWRLISQSRLERAKQKYGSADYRAASGQLRDILVATLAENYDDDLAKLTMPITMFWGANDTDVPVEVAQRALDEIPDGGALNIVDGVGHLTPTQAVEELVAVVSKVIA